RVCHTGEKILRVANLRRIPSTRQRIRAERFSRLRERFLVASGNGNASPFLVESFSGRQPDAAVSACHECYFSFKPTHAPHPLACRVRGSFHGPHKMQKRKTSYSRSIL